MAAPNCELATSSSASKSAVTKTSKLQWAKKWAHPMHVMQHRTRALELVLALQFVLVLVLVLQVLLLVLQVLVLVLVLQVFVLVLDALVELVSGGALWYPFAAPVAGPIWCGGRFLSATDPQHRAKCRRGGEFYNFFAVTPRLAVLKARQLECAQSLISSRAFCLKTFLKFDGGGTLRR